MPKVICRILFLSGLVWLYAYIQPQTWALKMLVAPQEPSSLLYGMWTGLSLRIALPCAVSACYIIESASGLGRSKSNVEIQWLCFLWTVICLQEFSFLSQWHLKSVLCIFVTFREVVSRIESFSLAVINSSSL